MKLILNDNPRYILRFDKGEELFSSLLEFVKQQNITAATLQAIGACSEVEVGDFDLSAKAYRKKTIKENLEVISLTGNIAILGNSPVLHIHGSFARHDLTMLGGHVFKLFISATCEVFLTKLDGEMKRVLDKDLNLNLLI